MKSASFQFFDERGGRRAKYESAAIAAERAATERRVLASTILNPFRVTTERDGFEAVQRAAIDRARMAFGL